MNPIQTKPVEKDKVVNVRQVEVEKKQAIVGSIAPKKGHTIWEINLVEHTIEPATFEELDVARLMKKEKPTSRGLGYIERNDGTKKIMLEGLPNVSKKIIKKKNCIYMSKLNRKGVLKQLQKLGVIKIVKNANP